MSSESSSTPSAPSETPHPTPTSTFLDSPPSKSTGHLYVWSSVPLMDAKTNARGEPPQLSSNTLNATPSVTIGLRLQGSRLVANCHQHFAVYLDADYFGQEDYHRQVHLGYLRLIRETGSASEHQPASAFNLPKPYLLSLKLDTFAAHNFNLCSSVQLTVGRLTAPRLVFSETSANRTVLVDLAVEVIVQETPTTTSTSWDQVVNPKKMLEENPHVSALCRQLAAAQRTIPPDVCLQSAALAGCPSAQALFPVHTFVLKLRAPALGAFVEGQLAEVLLGWPRVVQLEGVCSPVMETLLAYLYGRGPPEGWQQELAPLVLIAHKYEIQPLLQSALQALKHVLTDEAVAIALHVAVQVNAPRNVLGAIAGHLEGMRRRGRPVEQVCRDDEDFQKLARLYCGGDQQWPARLLAERLTAEELAAFTA